MGPSGPNLTYMRHTRFAFILVLLTCTLSSPALALPGDRQLLIPPVDAAIARHFLVPRTAYSRGHRGIDYAVPSRTPIRAAAAGRVKFAGRVAGNLAVTIEHSGGLESTYSMLARINVSAEETVGQGRYIGETGEAHPGDSGLHFGVKLHGEYVDPVQFLGPISTSGALHLAPLTESIADEVPYELSLVHGGAGTAARKCKDPVDVSTRPPAPTPNVAVAIAGIGSRTAGRPNAEIYGTGAGPASLGYPERLVYRFSYAGLKGKDLHAPYEATATYRDLKGSAARLIRLLRAIHKRHPDRSVDLFAHSQGGVVARAALERMAGSFDPRLPHVANLVTYASPHRGAPLARAIGDLDSTFTGGWLLDRAADLSDAAGPAAPTAPAVKQMAPDSKLLGALAREDVTFGTRVLALAMPHDVIVPADKALYVGKDSRILSPEGLNGHKAIVTSRAARAHVYAFLRGAPRACMSNWQEGGQLIGKGLGWAANLPVAIVEQMESLVLKRAVAVARGARLIGSKVKGFTDGRIGDAAERIVSVWSRLWD